MRLAYWHKLGIATAALSCAGVVITCAYALSLHREHTDFLAKSPVRLAGRVLALEAGALAVEGESTAARWLSAEAVRSRMNDIAPLEGVSSFGEAALFDSGKERSGTPIWAARVEGERSVTGSVAGASGVRMQTITNVEDQGNLISSLDRLAARASAEPATQQFIGGRLATPVYARPSAESAVVGSRKPALVGWIVLTPAEGANGSIRDPLLTFMGVLCAALAVLGLVIAHRATRRLRVTCEAMQRAGAGETEVHIEDDSDDELSQLAAAANHTARAMKQSVELRRSMRLGEMVQRALLPARAPSIAGLDIAHFCVYCDEVGGDYIDYIPLGGEDAKEGWAIVVGDGTGHGVPAAILMATARSVLRSHALRVSELPVCMAQINRLLCKQVPEGKFLTLFMLVMEPNTSAPLGVSSPVMSRLRWISAGHDEAIMLDAMTMQFSELKGSDLPLGVEESWEFNEYTRSGALAPGSIIVIGTDGIWESRSAAGAMFGKDHLRRLIRRHASSTSQEIGERILEALRDHRGALLPQDDVTFVVIKVAAPTATMV
ncbi:MAG: SpoIIE family protein phosphatase [Phycisphaerales bacterium]|nr:SpoIIE family protein phosphatase [Phycisphaerales bacterium]